MCFVQKLFASSSRRSDIPVPELLKKKHRKIQARAGGSGDEDDDHDMADEVLTDTNEDEIIDLNPKPSQKRKSGDTSDEQATKKTRTEVLGFYGFFKFSF